MTTRLALPALALGPAATAAPAQDLGTTLPDAVGQVAPKLEAYAQNDLFGSVWTDEQLSMRDRALVTVAAKIKRHETDGLSEHIALALDAGVTPAGISETITHLAFYTGWGNAVAAAEAAAPVYDERGVTVDDLPALAPELLPLDQEAEEARQETVQSTYDDVSQGVVDNTEQLLSSTSGCARRWNRATAVS